MDTPIFEKGRRPKRPVVGHPDRLRGGGLDDERGSRRHGRVERVELVDPGADAPRHLGRQRDLVLDEHPDVAPPGIAGRDRHVEGDEPDVSAVDEGLAISHRSAGGDLPDERISRLEGEHPEQQTLAVGPLTVPVELHVERVGGIVDRRVC